MLGEDPAAGVESLLELPDIAAPDFDALDDAPPDILPPDFGVPVVAAPAGDDVAPDEPVVLSVAQPPARKPISAMYPNARTDRMLMTPFLPDMM
ncbi:hypothetical protein W02_17260 [Nitrospira sp. KM1]|nr:hypothetical protein W02_17260 [Nitrospira sp. KM1]